MLLRWRLPVVAVFLSLLGLAACGDDGGTDASTIDAAIPDAAPRQVIESTRLLQVGELVEGAMTGGTPGMGDLAVITLSAPTADIGWNIHGHANGATQIIYEEHDKMTVSYTFAPATQAEWYLLVRNEGTASMEVMIKVELFGTMAWAWL